MVRSELEQELCHMYPNMLRKDIEKIIDIIIKEIIEALCKDRPVEIRGWGMFSPKIQKKRKSRNPKTGQELLIPEKKNIHFKMSKELLDELNNG